MNSCYDIRPVTLEELLGKNGLELVWEVFREFEAPDYSLEGIREFKSFIDPMNIARVMARGELAVWCCFEEERVVGLIALRPPCHISLLFVDKARHRQGIARALYRTLLAHCCGCREITVNSSPYAQEAYRRLGFANLGPEETVNGLRFFPMKHTL